MIDHVTARWPGLLLIIGGAILLLYSRSIEDMFHVLGETALKPFGISSKRPTGTVASFRVLCLIVVGAAWIVFGVMLLLGVKFKYYDGFNTRH